MSVAGPHADRQPDDLYETSHWVTDLILPHLARRPVFEFGPKVRVLEPCCGNGAILDRLVTRGAGPFLIEAVELDPMRAESTSRRYGVEVTPADFIAWAAAYDGPGYDLAITNPSYLLAMPIAQAMIAVTKKRGGEAALLLRLDWMSSQARAQFHRENPSDVYVLPRRPSFVVSCACSKKCGWREVFAVDPKTGQPREEVPAKCPSCGERVSKSTSDASDYGWFVFGPGRGGRWQILPSEVA